MSAIAVIAVCCKDKPPSPCDDNGLPCATTEGLNTFGCKVNGTNWVAEAAFSVGGAIALEGEYNESTGGFWLKGTRKTDNDAVYEYIKFYAVDISSTGVYEMSVLTDEILGFYDFKSNYPCQGYYHDTLNKGDLTISFLSTDEDVITGTFSAVFINATCGDTLYLTDGRFDFKY